MAFHSQSQGFRMNIQNAFNKSENRAVFYIVTIAVVLHVVFIWLIRTI